MRTAALGRLLGSIASLTTLIYVVGAGRKF